MILQRVLTVLSSILAFICKSFSANSGGKRKRRREREERKKKGRVVFKIRHSIFSDKYSLIAFPLQRPLQRRGREKEEKRGKRERERKKEKVLFFNIINGIKKK